MPKEKKTTKNKTAEANIPVEAVEKVGGKVTIVEA